MSEEKPDSLARIASALEDIAGSLDGIHGELADLRDVFENCTFKHSSYDKRARTIRTADIGD